MINSILDDLFKAVKSVITICVAFLNRLIAKKSLKKKTL